MRCPVADKFWTKSLHMQSSDSRIAPAHCSPVISLRVFVEVSLWLICWGWAEHTNHTEHEQSVCTERTAAALCSLLLCVDTVLREVG